MSDTLDFLRLLLAEPGRYCIRSGLAAAMELSNPVSDILTAFLADMTGTLSLTTDMSSFCLLSLMTAEEMSDRCLLEWLSLSTGLLRASSFGASTRALTGLLADFLPLADLTVTAKKCEQDHHALIKL